MNVSQALLAMEFTWMEELADAKWNEKDDNTPLIWCDRRMWDIGLSIIRKAHEKDPRPDPRFGELIAAMDEMEGFNSIDGNSESEKLFPAGVARRALLTICDGGADQLELIRSLFGEVFADKLKAIREKYWRPLD